MSKARQAIPTITFVDEYGQLYQDLFPEVRSFEHFKFLHIGMLSDFERLFSNGEHQTRYIREIV